MTILCTVAEPIIDITACSAIEFTLGKEGYIL